MRVIPSESLAEDALQDAVERLEEDVGKSLNLAQCPVSAYVQADLYQETKWLTAIVQYDDPAVVARMLTVRNWRVDVEDENRDGVMTCLEVGRPRRGCETGVHQID